MWLLPCSELLPSRKDAAASQESRKSLGPPEPRGLSVLLSPSPLQTQANASKW